MGSPTKRRDMDIMKLMMSDYEVELNEELGREAYDLSVVFHGPESTPYEGGVWRVKVQLPMEYPFKSPSIGFLNRIYHPNIDLASGSVCLDVINQTWSPLYSLLNIFDTFLPYLMRYPNGADPLNPEAGNLSIRDPEAYNIRVKEFVAKYAMPAGSKAAGSKAAPDASCGGAAGAAASAGTGAPGTTTVDTSTRSESFSSAGTGVSCSDDDDDDDDDDDSVASDLSDLSDL